MIKSRFSEERILEVLQELDNGGDPEESCRRLGISCQILYHWARKYGGLEVAGVRQLRALDEENRKLKQMVAEQLLEITAVRAALANKL